MAPDNAEQIEYWNGKAGHTWVDAAERLDRLLEPISAAVLERANAQPDERAVDVGCGCGTTTLALALSGASVWGVDISEPMLGLARKRAESRGIKNIAFSRADASTQTFTADHQLVFSRFGVMFFADPVAAFANLRTGLTQGGRVCFVCWQPPGRNPWMAVAGQAVAPFLPVPETPPDPRAPGPFAFADHDYLNSILKSAGYRNVQIDGITPVLHLATTLDEAMQFQGEVGPVARALAELDGEQKKRALAAARDALEGHLSADGIHLGAACWLVSASP